MSLEIVKREGFDRHFCVREPVATHRFLKRNRKEKFSIHCRNTDLLRSSCLHCDAFNIFFFWRGFYHCEAEFASSCSMERLAIRRACSSSSRQQVMRADCYTLSLKQRAAKKKKKRGVSRHSRTLLLMPGRFDHKVPDSSTVPSAERDIPLQG